MPRDAAFNVLIGNAASNGGRTALLTATTADRPSGLVTITNPQTNGNPNNVIFATQDYNPGGKGGTGNTGYVLAGYNGTHEGVFNWSGPPIPLKASFNLLIFSS